VVEVSTGEVKIIRSIHALWLESRHILLDCFVVEVLIRRWGWCVREWTHTHALSHKDSDLRTWNVFTDFLNVRLCVCLSVSVFLSLSLSLSLWCRPDNVFTKNDQKCLPELVPFSGSVLVLFSRIGAFF
jgi:hypothetical protein